MTKENVSFREDIRNIAIIAHVDHGKTTLVDELLKQSGTFRLNESVGERIMDSNDLEREKGITILSKVTSVHYNGIKINIVDTPGHSDFGGEVERVLSSVDGVLLLVDAFEGPMPQTRFVLKKALEQNIKPIVVINKIDKPSERSWDVVYEVMSLFIELNCPEELMDFPYIFASGVAGVAGHDPKEEMDDIDPLFKMIIKHIPPPQIAVGGEFQMLVTSLGYDDHVGRLFGGKITRGTISMKDAVCVIDKENNTRNFALTRLNIYEGLKLVDVESASAGDIVMLAGDQKAEIGDTISSISKVEALPRIEIDEPTVSMEFIVNTGPWAGKSGKFVTLRSILTRLTKESLTNVSLFVEETDSPDTLKVSGRGELQFAILLEQMRREGFEVCVSKPTAIIKEINGVKCEPIETCVIDISDEYLGGVIEELASRKGEIVNMSKDEAGMNRVTFEVPTRGLIGFRTNFMTLTRGYGLMSRLYKADEPYKGDIVTRYRGSIISKETGRATAYSIAPLQDRAALFISPGDEVYEGQVVGENSRSEDMVVNVTRAKHASNMRSSNEDVTVLITPARKFLLEGALSFIGDDELLEVTPDALRFRKRLLNELDRNRERRLNK